MSTSSNLSQSAYSASEPETPQGTSQIKLQNFDQSVSHVDLGHSIEQSVKSAQKEQHQKRIQALRKELDYLKSTEWEFEFDKEDDEEEDREEFLADQLLELEAVKEQNYIELNQPPAQEIPRDAICFQRTGVITYLDENYTLIDGMFYFDLTACSVKLNLNDKVLYLGYKDANDSIVVVRILENKGMAWEDEETFEEDNFQVFEHVIIGEVESRQERLVIIKESDLKFNLDDVEGSFIPIRGDWLEMNCVVQFDEDKPSEISSNQVLKVKSFKPVRRKIKNAVVTAWCEGEGICDRVIFFNKHCLQNGMEPQVGSKVMVEAIESNQGACTWRVIKLVMLDDNKPKETDASVQPSEDFINLDIETEKKVEFPYPIKFEDVDINSTQTITATLKNNSDEVYIMNKWIILSKKRDSQITIKPFLNRPTKLFPKQSFQFTITCQPKFFGNSKECFLIMFRGFQIKRFIEVNVSDTNHLTRRNNGALISDKEKVDLMKKVRRNDSSFVPGVKLQRPANFIPVRLGPFNIPDKVWSAVLGDSEQTIYSTEYDKILDRIETTFPCLTQDLSIHNYTDRWHTLLYIEEIQSNINMRVYDTPKAFLIRVQEYLAYEIAGLSERRPSLIKGDRVIVRDMWDNKSPKYEGYVHVIRGDLVLMKFSPQFHESYSGSDVSLEFHFSRSVYRRAHQAINLAISNLGPDILFPSKLFTQPLQVNLDDKNITFFNEKLNDGQKAAVSNILKGESRPLPYVIFGPPGTGKTVTIIETILQILTNVPDSRILMATPSNSAANLITERLIEHRKAFSDSMIRLIANYLVDSDNIPEKIKPFCGTLDIAREETVKSSYMVKDGVNLNCQKTFVGRHRVTIGTCYCLGMLAQMGFPRGHFTHIIVDEAGQATEPEIMIPLTFTDKENGQIILAGDPMQLGPVVMSKYAKEYAFDESFLSRLLETYPYQKDFDAFHFGYNNKLVTKLNDNYRSLYEVLKLPSEMFYDGSLVPNLDRSEEWVKQMTKVISEIFEQPDENVGGIYVYGIRGMNARAEDSPSWYNPQEASMVALTTCKLYKRNVSADDIGIIAPYIAQIKYLRLLFDAMGLPQPKIGTVEEFQGQERPIILISTVRSTESLLEEDYKHSLGFVKNQKRMNVALTRAQVAVILFCNPHLLCTDNLWNNVITNAVAEDKYMGCDLPFDFISNNKDIE